MDLFNLKSWCLRYNLSVSHIWGQSSSLSEVSGLFTLCEAFQVSVDCMWVEYCAEISAKRQPKATPVGDKLKIIKMVNEGALKKKDIAARGLNPWSSIQSRDFGVFISRSRDQSRDYIILLFELFSHFKRA